MGSEEWGGGVEGGKGRRTHSRETETQRGREEEMEK